MYDFHFIAVINFRLKIIIKILVDRLVVIACKIFSFNQNNVIKGMSIKNCIYISFKVINFLSKKV